LGEARKGMNEIWSGLGGIRV